MREKEEVGKEEHAALIDFVPCCIYGICIIVALYCITCYCCIFVVYYCCKTSYQLFACWHTYIYHYDEHPLPPDKCFVLLNIVVSTILYM